MRGWETAGPCCCPARPGSGNGLRALLFEGLQKATDAPFDQSCARLEEPAARLLLVRASESDVRHWGPLPGGMRSVQQGPAVSLFRMRPAKVAVGSFQSYFSKGFRKLSLGCRQVLAERDRQTAETDKSRFVSDRDSQTL